jgi:hypothetical protein
VILIQKDSSVETATPKNKMNLHIVVPNQDSKSPTHIKQNSVQVAANRRLNKTIE